MKSISTIARVQKHHSWLIQDLFSIPAMTGFSKHLRFCCCWKLFDNKNMKHNLQVTTLQLDLLFSFGLHRTRLLQTSILISPDSTFHTENFILLHFIVHLVCIHCKLHSTIHFTPHHCIAHLVCIHCTSQRANRQTSLLIAGKVQRARKVIISQVLFSNSDHTF